MTQRTHGGRRKGAGRPSKGDRHRFAVNLPREVADVVMAEAEERDCAYGELVAYYACRALGMGIPMPEGPRTADRELPLDRTA